VGFWSGGGVRKNKNWGWWALSKGELGGKLKGRGFTSKGPKENNTLEGDAEEKENLMGGSDAILTSEAERLFSISCDEREVLGSKKEGRCKIESVLRGAE